MKTRTYRSNANAKPRVEITAETERLREAVHELRAENWSFGNIAKKLKMSKSNAVKLSKEELKKDFVCPIP